MVPSNKASTQIFCVICGERRKKFPASWKMHGTSSYCSGCWEKVACSHCGHHDPKGDVVRGRWTCQACRHHNKVKLLRNVYEDCHRVIIEDCNGETPVEAAVDLSNEAEKPQRCEAEVLDKGFLEHESDQEFDEELEDEVAPLPDHGARRPGARHEASVTADPGHVVILIDTSGSMRNEDVRTQENGNQPEAICRLEAATSCAVEFVRAHWRQHPRDRFSLATFGDTAVVEGRLMSAHDTQAALETLGRRGAGGTSYLAALRTAVDAIAEQPSMRRHVVLLSDGRPADTKAALHFFQAEFLNGASAGAHIHGIGFGATVESFAPLQQLTCLSGGTFVLSTCTIQGLSKAFSSVSSTITSMSSGCFNDHGQGSLKRSLRPVTYEPPEIGEFGRRDVLRFHASRSAFQFDGSSFHEECCQSVEVARRLRPCMRGGMRLVYGFRDKQAVKDDGSWMVAKASRFLDQAYNARGVVESHAKSTAVARYYAARFNERLRSAVAQDNQSATKPPTMFFVPCYVYSAAETDMLGEDEPRIFAGERFLPGAFLKYNSNNGYVSEESLRHHEAVQAFTHFSFQASGGRLMVADLQGVVRASEALLTDPQALSLDRSFGPGDLGSSGMRACLAAHRCGPTCRRLGLEPVNSKMIRRLAALGGRRDIAHRHPLRPSSAPSSSGWEHLSEPDVSDQWDKLSDRGIADFAMSDGVRSSQGSSCSWINVADA